VTNQASPALYAVAGRDRTGSEILLDVANPGGQAIEALIDLHGVARLQPQVTAIVLTSASPDDVNSFEAPMKIAPHEETVAISGPSFARMFPAYSLTVLRLKPVN
jgi:alpha-N-arabinofuranosidase